MPLGGAAAVKAGARVATKRAKRSKERDSESKKNRQAKSFFAKSLKIGLRKNREESGTAADQPPKKRRGKAGSQKVFRDKKDPRITYSSPRPGRTRKPSRTKRGK